MAVDQASTHADLMKYLLSINKLNASGTHNPVQISNNNLYSHSTVTNPLAVGPLPPTPAPPPANESLLIPFYGLNDVVFSSGVGKFQPAVKDDSGLTFNNSFIPAPASRKRAREPAVEISGGALPSLLAANPIASTCNSSIVNKEANGFSFLGEDISLQIMQQQLELDRLISQHIETMKMETEDRKKQQLRRIMAAIEEAMAQRMREKEEEIENISRINLELEERVKNLCLENQLWRDLAQSNEATANVLRTNLEQVLQQMRENAAGELTDDAVSCCGSSGYGEEREGEDGGERWQRRRVTEDEEGNCKKWVYRGEKNRRLCRKCGEGESSVLLLPCRHLCLCTACGPTVNACPICNSVKNASVHVNLS